jgi:hypothetical protein
MCSNTCSRNTLTTSTPYKTHTTSSILEAGSSLRRVIYNPLREPDGTWHFKTEVAQLLRKLFKAARLLINGFEFSNPWLDALPTSSRDKRCQNGQGQAPPAYG